MDRVAPTRRPEGRPVMRQEWHHLLFLHWAVPVDQLRALVPAAIDIDTFEGRAYVGLVPFTMTGVRPIWSPPVPFLSRFHETNVRTYVHYRGRNPGVWFFSLDAANAVAVQVARAFWSLPYFFARMRMEHGVGGSVTGSESAGASDHDESPGWIDYRSERRWPQPTPAALHVRYAPRGAASPAVVGSLEHFLTERYILYTGEDRRLASAQVHHQPYPVQAAVVQSLSENVIASARIKRGDEAPICHYAHGVNVEVFPIQNLAAE